MKNNFKALSDQVAHKKQNVYFAPEEHTLSNGIPVLLQDFEGTVSTLYWWISVGSCDESLNQAGFAHFLEHMLFKDTSAKETGKASTGKTARAIESLGGDINAYTSFDQTVYHVTCADKHFEKVIDEFGKMAKPERFLKVDFDREKEVILEELKKGQDSPGRHIFQNLFSASFAKHPYGRPVIGFEKILKRAKVGELEKFYFDQYQASNMGIIIVGPMGDEKGLRKKNILKKLERRFGSSVLKKKEHFRPLRPIEKQLRIVPSVKISGFQVQTPSLAFAFRVPELSHKDIPALDLLSGVLGFGESSRLYQKLFYDKAMVTEVSSGLFVPNDPGILYFNLDTEKTENLENALQEAFQEINNIYSHPPEMEELERVITNIESEKLYATQTVDGMASRLGYLKFVLGKLDFDQKYIDELRKVTPSDIQKIAREYFQLGRMSLSVLLPKKDVKLITVEALQELAQKYFKTERISSVPTQKKFILKPKQIEPRSFVSSSGLQVIHYERPHSHVVSAHLSALGGSRLESQELQGASFLTSLTWAKGTESKSSQDISRFIERRAAQLDGFSGRNSIGMELTCLARDWGDLSTLFKDILFHPVFSENEIKHSKRLIEDAIKGIEDHSAQMCSQLFLETLYEHHPYGKLIYGTLESLAKLKSEHLHQIHRQWIQPERLILSVSGAISEAELDFFISDLDQSWRNSQFPKWDASFLNIQNEPELKGPRWVEKNLKREQTHIMIGNLGIQYQDQDRYALRLLQTILSGQSGRLFIELREKKSLAYTVSPMIFEGIEKGYTGVYIASSASKKDEAIKGIKTVIEKFARTGPTETELKRAKEYYLGQKAMELQSDHSLSAHYGLQQLYGTKPSEEISNEKSLLRVSVKDVKRVTEQYFLGQHKVTSIVG